MLRDSMLQCLMLRASMLMAFNHEDHEALALKHSITKYEAFNRDLRDKMLRAL